MDLGFEGPPPFGGLASVSMAAAAALGVASRLYAVIRASLRPPTPRGLLADSSESPRMEQLTQFVSKSFDTATADANANVNSNSNGNGNGNGKVQRNVETSGTNWDASLKKRVCDAAAAAITLSVAHLLGSTESATTCSTFSVIR